jgi:hypothetical protein
MTHDRNRFAGKAAIRSSLRDGDGRFADGLRRDRRVGQEIHMIGELGTIL